MIKLFGCFNLEKTNRLKRWDIDISNGKLKCLKGNTYTVLQPISTCMQLSVHSLYGDKDLIELSRWSWVVKNIFIT